jgi:DNA repair exonuclease SbcCD nuclease subunit
MSKNKIILSSDWHVGNQSGSERHNKDLIAFTKFMIDWSVKNDVNRFYHLGDFFHSRDKIDVFSINYGIEIVKLLNNRFGKFKMIKGNHDLPMRDSRDFSSLQIFQNMVDLVDYYHIEDNFMLVSWLTSAQEYDEIINISKQKKVRFMGGHYEFSTFKMNDHYEMEHGQSHKELRHIERVFTGHYHGRQIRDNVVYIGSPFPFDFNDANDTERGFTVLDLDTGEYELIKWNNIHILSVNHKEFLENDFSVVPNCSIRVVINEELDNKTMEALKEKLGGNFRDTKIVYTVDKVDEALQAETKIDGVVGIDEAVLTHLKNMNDIDGIDRSMLIDLYTRARDNGKN